MSNNNEKPRTFYNLVGCTGAERRERSGHKLLNLRFSVWNKEEKKAENKFHSMFLTQENNERNQEALQYLGCTNVPDRVTFETVENLEGLGSCTVDLVEQENARGYLEIKFINKPRFGMRVFDEKV